ncbi:MAG: hypothetical protein B7Y39_09450 [Bdellovibrio sp. 28-41-41]|nr:MAG: hypothetical protein B7Y39_09450 [Bdellovibrio sp. 28-41-41]
MMPAKGYVFAITSLIFMSLAGPLHKLGSANSHPLLVTFCSCSAAFLIALIGAIYLRKQIFRELNRTMTILSFLYALAMVCFSYAVTLENPFVVSAVARSYIGFSFILSIYFLKEGASKNRWPAVFVIVLGSLAVSLSGSNNSLHITIGTLLALVYALLFAIHNYYLKQNSNISVLGLLFWQNLFAALFTLAVNPGVVHLKGFHANTIIFSALSGILSSVVGFVLYHRSIRLLSFGEVTSIRAFSPIIGGLIVAPFFPPTITPALIVGFILILSGHYFYFKSEVENASAPNRRILSLFKRKKNTV